MRAFLANEDSFSSFLLRESTIDGLVPCSKIQIQITQDRYELLLPSQNNLPVFPVPEGDQVTDYLVDHSDLWRQASLRLSFAPSICGSAPMFGVPFRRAVEIALASGHVKSKFYFPNQAFNKHYKTLLLHLDRTQDARGDLVQLQAWHYTPGQTYAYYLHALSPAFNHEIYHLDGATISFSEPDLDVLLLDSRKIKGTNYQKHFRLDGSFSIEHMHSIARFFFPCTELYDEAFEIQPVALHA
ncbi:hypothetical protein [Geothrix edaphica]|uniref:DUF3822 family protein n=1 Tax=Geothrix edaphica TaxID=2927976 RepID=A0ABQ5PXG8_9BACT|nr:hypothetical protein [Geothrix edaphica]GLH67165.1 hypothetical protein GETHED_15290 [Geothrix edaphica]